MPVCLSPSRERQRHHEQSLCQTVMLEHHGGFFVRQGEGLGISSKFSMFSRTQFYELRLERLSSTWIKITQRQVLIDSSPQTTSDVGGTADGTICNFKNTHRLVVIGENLNPHGFNL